MVCIYCGNSTEVYNSRTKTRNPSVWRRRRCTVCVAQFSTEELPVYQAALIVKGRNGNPCSFSRDKLFLSLHRALSHRKDAVTTATELTNTVIGSLLRKKQAADGVIPLESIASGCYKTLKRFDPLAAHTYKAYHQVSLRV